MYLVGGEDWQTRMHKNTKVRIWMNCRITMKIDYIFISAKETIKKLCIITYCYRYLYNIYNLETLPDLCFLMDLQDVKRIIGCNKMGIFDINW